MNTKNQKTKETPFDSTSVAYPLALDEFSDIDPSTKKKLLRLMARISEASFRRGFQHGKLETTIADPFHLRYRVSLDKSPYTNVTGKNGKWICSHHSSLWRLNCECSELTNIGFKFDETRP